MTTRCKFGTNYAASDPGDRKLVDELIKQNAGPSKVAAQLTDPVYRGVARAHMNKLCKCYRAEESAAPISEAQPEAKPKVKIPQGWQPRAEWGEDGGTVVTVPEPVTEYEDEADDVYQHFPGVDPKKWQAKGFRRATWQNAAGEWLESYKADFVPREGAGEANNMEHLLEVLERARPTGANTVENFVQGSAYVVASGDHQTGKTDTNGGSTELVERFVETTEQAKQRMQRFGQFDTVVLAHLGDHIEGHVSQNGRLIATQDLATPEQVLLFQRLLLHQIQEFASLTPELIIALVDGNHDAAQRVQAVNGHNGWAVTAAASVADTLRFAGGYDHVKFAFPARGEETVVVDVADTRLGLVHGHQWRGGPAGVEKWLAGQSLGRLPIGDSDVLLSGHYHHLRVEEVGAGQSCIQVPSMDGGSKWFRDSTGADSPAGLLSFVVKGGRWEEMQLHRS